MDNPKVRPAQPWLIRLTHWANVPLLSILALSGLQIWIAYPYLGEKGALLEAFPLQGWKPPESVALGGWLAGGRHWHFAFAWLFVFNALAYVVYVFATGEWRDRFFLPRRDIRNALATAAYYVRIRREAPAQGKYNGLLRLGYTSSLVFAACSVWSGLVMYKPVQWRWLGIPLGGYEGARIVHTASLVLLIGFTIGHVIMVLLHPRTFPPMITGKDTDPQHTDKDVQR